MEWLDPAIARGFRTGIVDRGVWAGAGVPVGKGVGAEVKNSFVDPDRQRI